MGQVHSAGGRRLMVVAAAAALAVAAGGSLVWAVAVRGHGGGTQRSVAATPPAPTARVISTATPGAITSVTPISMSFPDARDGWALLDACDAQQRCTAAISRTTDGGATWAQMTQPPPALTDDARITAASAQDAWVWGGASSGAHLLVATHDGGDSWQTAHVGGAAVTSVVAAGGMVWAALRCTGAAAGATCLTVLTSPVHSDSWTPAAALPPAVQVAPYVQAMVVGPQLVLGAHRTWVLAGGAQQPEGLARSDDAGRSWVALDLPCGDDTMTMSASSDDHLVLACVRIGAWPAPQEVWSSHDGGAHWTLRSRAAADAAARTGSLPNTGAPLQLDSVDETTTWMANDRGADLVTHDDGVTWTPAPLADDRFRDSGIGVSFVDAQHGWTFSPGGLWATTDGGVHWVYQPLLR